MASSEISLPSPARRIVEGARALSPRGAAKGMVDSFSEHDLLVEAGAIAFRVLLTFVPALLFIFGLMGFLGLEEVWRSDLAPELRSSVSPPAYQLIDDAVINVLTSKQLFWVTLGLGIAVWEVSGVVRASQQVLIRIYGVDESGPPLAKRLAGSIAVGAAVGASILVAIIVVRLGPLLFREVLGDGVLVDVASFVGRWTLGLSLLLLAVGLVLRTAPGLDRGLHWVSFGAVVVVVAWVVSSVLFLLYLTQLADYGSIYGNLATVFVLAEYLFLVSIVFLGGLVLDSLVEDAS